jgi:signal transduction histidine kinase/CheY-like chemotaxis protein
VLDIDMRGQERSLWIMAFGIHDSDGEMQGIGTISVDLTELRDREKQFLSLEAELIQASKMEAIGQLARGVAHDFNNLLGGIVGFAGFLKDDLKDRPDLQSHAERIMTICERAKGLVYQIQSFGGAARIERQPIELRAVVSEARDVLRSRLPCTTELIYDLGDRPIYLVASGDQVSRLIVNLCVNASDALGGGLGRVTVRLTLITVTEEIIEQKFAPDRTHYVSGIPAIGSELACIEVADTGSGMEPETLARIMEPFFTTKGRKEGTGLGLWIVDGIIHAYRGYSVIHSRLGEGTIFSIYLPYEANTTVEDESPIQPETHSPQASRGSERVLVVDDQQDVLDVFVMGLRRVGFEPTSFSDPLAALEQFQLTPELWDVVVTDQLMPGMRGTELLARLREVRPGLRTVVCTGYAGFADEAPMALEHVDLTLTKPIEPAALAGHIRALIDGKVTARGGFDDRQ